MSIKRQYAIVYLLAIAMFVTLYLLAIAMVAISITICEKSAMKMCMIMTFRMENVKYKYANGMALCDFLFVGNSNVYPINICEILTIKMWMTLTLTFKMGQGQM